MSGSPKKAAKKAAPAHPPAKAMVTNAIKDLKERNGSSLAAIKKFCAANYKFDVEKKAFVLRRALKTMVEKGELTQTKGKGASGSFKLTVAKKAAVKKPKAKKPKAKKPKVKKVKKSPKKAAKKPAKKTKSPKKAKKPAAKKAKKPAAKKAKKPAAKKAKPAKKAAKPKKK